MKPLFLATILAFFITGCGETESADAPLVFAMVGDQGLLELDQSMTQIPQDAETEPRDLNVDMGRPADSSVSVLGLVCDPCESDGECASGGQCLTNQTTGEQFCGAVCDIESDCPRGTTCYELSETQKQCVPFSGSCANFPPSDLGGPCTDDSECQNGATLCDLVGDRGYCTLECTQDSECITGLSNCVENRCIADWTKGPEGCGRLMNTVVENCGDDGACPNGQTCLTEIIEDYPSRLGALCGVACNANTPCPDNTRCAQVGDAGTFCLPEVCECLARPPEEATFDRALQSVELHRCDVGIESDTLNRFEWSMAQDVFRLPFFNRIYSDAYGGYRWARHWRTSIAQVATAGTVAQVVRLSAQTLGVDVPTVPLPPTQNLGMNEIINALFERAGVPANTAPDLSGFNRLPVDFQRSIIKILNGQLHIIDTRKSVDEASGLNANFFESMYPHVLSALITRPDFVGLNLTNRDLKRLADKGYGYGEIVEAGAALVDVIQGIDWTPFIDLNLETVRLETPYGSIIIQGNQPDLLLAGNTPLLLIDTGGNDSYQRPVGATSSWAHPVSVAID